MTPAEIQALINSLIIDNNTNQVTPAKLREVLYAINNAIAINDPASVTAVAPLLLNNFTNEFTIQVVTTEQDGYLTKEDYILFKQNVAIPQADKITIKNKGYFNGVKNTGTIIELGDICKGFGTGPGEWIDSMMYISLGDDQDINNYERIYSAGVSVLPIV